MTVAFSSSPPPALTTGAAAAVKASTAPTGPRLSGRRAYFDGPWVSRRAIVVHVSECVFCEIVAGRLPSHRVLEDEHTIAFLDIRPAALGHTLVVPRVHARDLWEISEAAHGEVTAMVHRVAALLRTALAAEGVNVKHNTGAAAGQDVFHFSRTRSPAKARR